MGPTVARGDVVKWFNTEVCKTASFVRRTRLQARVVPEFSEPAKHPNRGKTFVQRQTLLAAATTVSQPSSPKEGS